MDLTRTRDHSETQFVTIGGNSSELNLKCVPQMIILGGKQFEWVSGLTDVQLQSFRHKDSDSETSTVGQFHYVRTN